LRTGATQAPMVGAFSFVLSAGRSPCQPERTSGPAARAHGSRRAARRPTRPGHRGVGRRY